MERGSTPLLPLHGLEDCWSISWSITIYNQDDGNIYWEMKRNVDDGETDSTHCAEHPLNLSESFPHLINEDNTHLASCCGKKIQQGHVTELEL